jgi:two-component system, chemotaxis family, chemotaxis protein CheY
VPRILLVDDDELLRGALHQILVGAGYDVDDASNGKVAVREYRRQRCDVVIMDIVMPDEEGLGTIRELRRLDPNVKIIAISGGGLGKAGDYLGLARMLGAMRTLAKPFLPEALLAMIVEVLADPNTPKVSPHRE